MLSHGKVIISNILLIFILNSWGVLFKRIGNTEDRNTNGAKNPSQKADRLLMSQKLLQYLII